MEVYFHPFDRWQEVNKKLKLSLPAEYQEILSKNEVRLYPSVAFAVLDSFYGLRSLFSFKKDFGFFKGQDPNIDMAAKAITASGLSPKTFGLSDENLNDKLEQFITKETCFFSFSTSDPIFFKAEETSLIEKVINEKSLAFIRVDYQSNPKLLNSIGPKGVHIVGLSNGAAACILGERVNYRSHFCPSLDWNSLSELPKWCWLDESKNQNVNLESFSPEFKPLMSADQQPLARKVLYSDMIDAAALIALMQKEQPNVASHLSTPSLSYWGGVDTMDWLKDKGYELNQLQGTIVVDQSIISDKLIADLKLMFKRILELQNGDQRQNEASSFNN